MDFGSILVYTLNKESSQQEYQRNPQIVIERLEVDTMQLLTQQSLPLHTLFHPNRETHSNLKKNTGGSASANTHWSSELYSKIRNIPIIKNTYYSNRKGQRMSPSFRFFLSHYFQFLFHHSDSAIIKTWPDK